MIIIVNNETKFLGRLKSRLRKFGVDFIVKGHSEPIDLDKINKVKGVILSGGPGDPFGPANFTTDFELLMNLKIPILGICLGHQIMGTAFGSNIEELDEMQRGLKKVIIKDKKSPLFKGLKEEEKFMEAHSRYITNLPKNFKRTAYSETILIEAMEHKRKPIYGVQFHPEASGKPGEILLKNFLRICKIRIRKAS